MPLIEKPQRDSQLGQYHSQANYAQNHSVQAGWANGQMPVGLQREQKKTSLW